MPWASGTNDGERKYKDIKDIPIIIYVRIIPYNSLKMYLSDVITRLQGMLFSVPVVLL